MIVRDVRQDGRGFIWLAGDGGLWRWSGTEFQLVDLGVRSGLAVRRLAEGAGQTMWVGTSEGLYAVDEFSLTVRWHFPIPSGLPINALLLDASGTIWAGTSRGLYVLSPAGGSGTSRAFQLVEGTGDFEVQSLKEDGDGAVWVGTRGAVYRWDPGRSEAGSGLTRHFDEAVSGYLVEAMHRSADGALWVGLRHERGFFCASEKGVRWFGAGDGLLDDQVNAIAEDGHGDIWVGTETGLFRHRGGRFTAIGQADGLTNTDIHALTVDREGQIWIGSYGGGVYCLRSPSVRTYGLEDGLPHPMVTAVAFGTDGGLALGTISGGARFDTRMRTCETLVAGLHFELAHVTAQGQVWLIGPDGTFVDGQPFGATWGRVRAVASDAAGRVFVGTHGGGLFRVEGEQTTNLTVPGDVEGPIQAMACAEDGSLLVGTAGGMFRRRDDVWTDVVAGHDVRAILAGPDGAVFLGTADGVVLMDSGRVERLGLRGRGARFEGPHGQGSVGVAPDGAGVVGLRDGSHGDASVAMPPGARVGAAPDGASVAIARDGMAVPPGGDAWSVGEVRELVRGPDGSVWGASAGGILRWKDGVLDRFDASDGLPCGDVRSVAIDGRGVLFAGTTQGLAEIDVDRIGPSVVEPLITIDRLVAGGRHWPPSDRAVELSYAQRDVLIQVACVGWRVPQPIRYQFLLEGYETDWSAPTSQTVRSYAGLPAGRYTVKVRGVDGRGSGSANVAAFGFTVLDPWWRHAVAVIAAFGIGVVLILALVVGYLRLFPVGRRAVLAIIGLSLLGGMVAESLDVYDWLSGHSRAAPGLDVNDVVLFTPFLMAVGLIAALSHAAKQAKAELEQKERVQFALRVSEQYNRDLFNSCSTGLALCRMDGTLVDVNPAYAQITGHTVAEVLRKTYWDLTPGRYRDQERRQLESLEQTGRYGPYEKEYIHKDGHLVVVRLSGTILEKGGQRFIWSTVEDITEQRRAQDEARLHQEELIHVARLNTLGEMTSELAHEISQPLAAIANYAQGALRRLSTGAFDSAQFVDPIKQIAVQAQRAGEIIRRVRALIRKEKPQRVEVDLRELIEDVAALMEGDMRRAEVTLRMEVGGGLPAVLADPVQIEQVILNLVRNAVESMSESGRPERDLVIETGASEGNGAFVAVHDTGRPLPPEAIQAAFEPFYTTKPYGMGMGLSICRSLIEGHGGRIEAWANAQGGMTVRFTLPVVAEVRGVCDERGRRTRGGR